MCLRLRFWAKYEGAVGSGGVLADFALALTEAFKVSATSIGEMAKLYASLNTYGADIASGQNHGNDTGPRGYLTVLVFDKNYNLVLESTCAEKLDETFVQTSGKVKPFDLLSCECTIKEPGYVYVFLSNEGENQQNIYFDDLSYELTHSPVVAGADYYPFGLPMDGREVTDEFYRYGYQGQFSERDSVTQQNEFSLRSYDA